ncbi:Spindle assembly checkpoint component MAD1 [Cyphellophora attinorum]|uniref:Spindle assembly checkpoint component MAD1 n=1 Tax=Cyphellophora attinorum TaxID=1664694 RepID=A0A0N0NMG8_9EURO|nr:Spindle assembly checkpoint component MAD1 [Phialophora attinorum]KPI40338.1 Spindle assembly checkpoint component MAD1 [Phialophora attinorum]
MSSPPGSTTKRQRLSSMRQSIRTPLRTSQHGASAIPVPSQSNHGTKGAASQPTYDFLSGDTENNPPAKRTMLRKSSFSNINHAENENYRAKAMGLEYELKNLQQERNMLKLQHEKELRDVQARADADFKKYQSAESASQKATLRYDALQKEMRDVQDQIINEKAALERKLRDMQDQNAALKEDSEDAEGRLADSERHYKHQLHDVEGKRVALQETVDKLREDLARLTGDFENSQTRLAQRDAEVAGLEAQVVDLKTHTGDSDALGVLQTQLSEQVTHIRNLEITNREQGVELRRLRDAHRSVQVVEEQKRGLETELQVLQDVERQLGEAQIQKEILQDEKRQWTSLLEQNGEQPEFESPEAVVKALVETRLEVTTLSERIGLAETDLAEKDGMLTTIDAERNALKDELRKAKEATPPTTSDSTDNKAYKRLERAKALAVKETDYLRAQLNSLNDEETSENPNYDGQRAEQIKQLESLVDQYKTEIATLHADISKLEQVPASEPRGTKRPAESQEPDAETSEQLGPLLRKNKHLQVALQKTGQQSKMLATELQAAKAQLKSLRESSKTRVLELRDNPTAKAEAIKMSTLRTLKEENTNLLSQLRGEDLQGVKVVPVSTVDALKLDMEEMQIVLAEKDKTMRRQREIWTQKAAEFRDVIASVLGWRIIFLPNGKAKVSSVFYGKEGEADDEDADEHSITFDGENGTMKISGGTTGPFAQEIKEQVDFWVKEKKEIPGFLAALTIQFHDEYRSR